MPHQKNKINEEYMVWSVRTTILQICGFYKNRNFRYFIDELFFCKISGRCVLLKLSAFAGVGFSLICFVGGRGNPPLRAFYPLHS